ncbi:unnamed protein product, partial [Rotaria sp. Silwood1]
DFVWLSMPHCLILGINISSLWRASTGTLIKKINDLYFSLPTQRLISNKINLNDVETTPDTIYIKTLLSCSNNQPYLIALIDYISIYFDTMQNHVELGCQSSYVICFIENFSMLMKLNIVFVVVVQGFDQYNNILK